MKSLNEYIYESSLTEGSLTEGLLDRAKSKEVNHKIFIEEFLEANYKITGSYDIKETKNGFVVDIKSGVNVKNKNITSLTNGLFKFGTVSEHFYCGYCKSLKSLEGAPKEVKGSFDCSNCDSLKTLEGAPQKVGWNFNCSNCESLKSLEGAPKEVGWSFICSNCGTKFTEEDVKKYTKVTKEIYI